MSGTHLLLHVLAWAILGSSAAFAATPPGCLAQFPPSGSSAGDADAQDSAAEAPPAEDAATADSNFGRFDFLDEYLDRASFIRDRPWVQALIVLLAAMLLARVLDWVVTRILRRLASRTEVLFDDQVVDWIHRPLVRSTVLFGLALGTARLPLGDPLRINTQRIILTIALLLWVPFAFRTFSLVLRSASSDSVRYKGIEPRTFPLFDNLGKVLLFGAFVYASFKVWGKNPTALLASAGLIGLALSFAAQDTLSNLLSGVMIIADAPYQVGDFITLDSGERGQVLHIGLRSTRLLTRDDIEVTVPNAVMGGAKITNEAGGPSTKRRVRIPIQAAYGADVDRVREVLMDAARATDNVCANPEPRVRFRAFGDSGLDFELLCWIAEPVLRGRVVDALNTAVYRGFQEAGLEIPFPKRDLYVKELPVNATTPSRD